MTITKVVTNDGLLRFDSAEFANNSSVNSSVSQAETITGSLAAGISIAVSGISVPGGMAGINPSAQAMVQGSVQVTGQAMIPPQCDGTLYFGIHYVMADVQIHHRNALGKVTSRPALAWAPTAFGYSDGFRIPVPGPTPPNPLCTQAASVKPVVPNSLQFLKIILAGPRTS